MRRERKSETWNKRNDSDFAAFSHTQNFVPQNWSIPIVWFSIMTHLKICQRLNISCKIGPSAHRAPIPHRTALRPLRSARAARSRPIFPRPRNRSLLFARTSDLRVTPCHTAARNATVTRHGEVYAAEGEPTSVRHSLNIRYKWFARIIRTGRRRRCRSLWSYLQEKLPEVRIVVVRGTIVRCTPSCLSVASKSLERISFDRSHRSLIDSREISIESSNQKFLF